MEDLFDNINKRIQWHLENKEKEPLFPNPKIWHRRVKSGSRCQSINEYAHPDFEKTVQHVAYVLDNCNQTQYYEHRKTKIAKVYLEDGLIVIQTTKNHYGRD